MVVPPKDAPHGQKRRAEDELANDQRLVKRFDLLNLGESLLRLFQPYSKYAYSTERNGKLYIPVNQTVPAASSQANDGNDSMQIDDTRDRVYIHSLDEELKTVDEEETRALFLPDIERKLNKIPKSVLTGHSQPLTRNEVVLYSVPTSLTVPREQDSVRKAIVESRARARQKQADDVKAAPSGNDTTSATGNRSNATKHVEEGIVHGDDMNDEDAMDLG